MNLKIVKKQTDMKKNILIIAILLSSLFVAQGQEKGLHLAISGNYGCNLYNYTLDDKNRSEFSAGWGAGLAAQYFFTKHWGISLGVEWFSYNGRAIYGSNWQRNAKHYVTEHMIEGRPILLPTGQITSFNEDYTLQLSVHSWTEKQHGYVLNIPLMAQYQTKWGIKESVGMYWAAGLKFQVPVLDQTYSVETGTLQVMKYYPNYDLTVGADAPAPTHGAGITDEYGFGDRYDGVMKTKKLSMAAAGELGLLFSFSRRVDFAVGAYLDYGFLNIKLRDAHASGNLIMPTVDDNKEIDPHALDAAKKIGDGLIYNGFLQSAAVDKVNLLAFGAKATLRIKLTKLDEQGEESMTDRQWLKQQMDEESKQRGQQAEDDRTFYKGLLQALADTIVEVHKPDPLTSKEWNPDSPYSPNNPNNPDYAYPTWYTPDYVNDPAYQGKAGMGNQDEGPNNANAVTRNHNKVKQIMSNMSASIYFDLSKYDLREDAFEVLDRKIELMKKYPNLMMTLVGHTCDIGSNTLNDELSYNRCLSARNYMIRRGIRASRIDIVSMGKHHPDYPNDSEESRELNRRVDFMTVE
jgi:outer membrane protein OmpA-like peptidoglycan-associated protein